MASEKPSSLTNALFVATHPVSALRAKLRQVAVSIDSQAPPAGSTFEEFSELPLADATRLIHLATREEKDGVPRESWSKTDQERMMAGKKPKGMPEHPNV